MKSKIFIMLILSIVLVGCRLDDLMYNPEKITEYKYDNYTGLTDFEVPTTYNISKDKIYEFKMPVYNDTIYGIYIGDTARIKTDTVILYCHGRSRNMDSYWNRAKLLANVGYKHRFGVLIFDYRGYGLSTGKPSEAGIYNDATTATHWLQDKGLTSDRLVMYGFSMGTAPATELSSKPRCLLPQWKLILEAPFASTDMMMNDGSNMTLPASFITDIKFDNAEEIKNVSNPFLWIHGVEDDYISMKHGQAVYDNYQGKRKEKLLVEGANHSDIPLVYGLEKYNQAILNFILNK